MSESNEIQELADREYEYGFVTDIEQERIPKGLSEDTVRLISSKKNEPEWLLEWRLKAYRRFLEMLANESEPTWAAVDYPQIDYQDMYYYAAPKPKKELESLDEVDPELLATYDKLGIPLEEQKRLSGVKVAVDAVFDSVSVATTYKAELEKKGIIFCSFSEAVRDHPELVQKYLGSVVPYSDNFFAALNSAVFSDGSFAYIPKGVRCPMELSTYFRINAEETGQFERTLIIAEEGAYVSYLEGCTAPQSATRTSCTPRSSNSSPWTTPRSSTRPSRTGTPATRTARAASTTSSPSAAPAAASAARSRGRRSRRARRSPGSTPRASCRATTRWASSTRSRSPTTAAGRHRHEDDPHRQEHEEHDHLEGHQRGSRPAELPRPRAMGPKAHGARNYSQCDSLLLGDQCGAHTFPYLEVKNSDGDRRARGHDVEDRRGPALLLPSARHLGRGRDLDDRERLLQGGPSRAPDGVRRRSADSCWA